MTQLAISPPVAARRRMPLAYIVAFAPLLGASPALAHAFLQTATPAVGSTIPASQAELTITFTEGVEPAFSTIDVIDMSGGHVETGEVHNDRGDTSLAIGLKALRPGSYTVHWHVTSVDTHKTEGSYSFTVAP